MIASKSDSVMGDEQSIARVGKPRYSLVPRWKQGLVRPSKRRPA